MNVNNNKTAAMLAPATTARLVCGCVNPSGDTVFPGTSGMVVARTLTLVKALKETVGCPFVVWKFGNGVIVDATAVSIGFPSAIGESAYVASLKEDPTPTDLPVSEVEEVGVAAGVAV